MTLANTFACFLRLDDAVHHAEHELKLAPVSCGSAETWFEDAQLHIKYALAMFIPTYLSHSCFVPGSKHSQRHLRDCQRRATHHYYGARIGPTCTSVLMGLMWANADDPSDISKRTRQEDSHCAILSTDFGQPSTSPTHM